MATYKGIDVSKWQKAGEVNYKNLKKLGYTFVIVRAGFGKELHQKDPAFESHYAAARAAGLKVGAYHYSYAKTVDEALIEADCFLTWIKGKKLEYPVAFDIEDKTQKSLTDKERTDIAIAFMQKVEDAGYYVMLYSSANWLENKFERSRLKSYDTWLACYTSEDRRNKLYTGKFGIWQYTSSLDLPTVYSSRLDANIAYKDYARIIKRAGLNHLK